MLILLGLIVFGYIAYLFDRKEFEEKAETQRRLDELEKKNVYLPRM
jgi:hypothetical protein